MITTAQAAIILEVSRSRILKLIEAKRLPAEKLGRDWLIRLEDLEGHPAIKGRRRAAANGRAADQTPDRLRVREAVKRKKLAQLKREI